MSRVTDGSIFVHFHTTIFVTIGDQIENDVENNEGDFGQAVVINAWETQAANFHFRQAGLRSKFATGQSK